MRFVWWAGEELGLLGSSAYVAGLSDAELDHVVAYVNADMIGSPNAVVSVYDGRTDLEASGRPGPPGVPALSPVIEAVLTEQGVPFETSELDGRSDHLAFAAAGIPSGGVFTGARELKSPDQAARLGGVANAPMDPCYHQACDSLAASAQPGGPADPGGTVGLLGNVDLTVLDAVADALATVAVRLAADPGLLGTG